jgi:acyl-CoA synthetase (AMP-forming)/AMP-acid ligase II
VIGALRRAGQDAAVLARAGILRPMGPRTLAAAVAANRRWDRTLASGVATSAARYGSAEAIVDERGALSYSDLHRRSNALAHALADRGAGPGRAVGLLCRDHRHFIETVAACSKLGVDVLLLNTSFSATQLRDVLDREGAKLLVHDAEFGRVAAQAAGDRTRIVAWREPGEEQGRATLIEDLVAKGDESNPSAPQEPGRQILLTSGTTGTPKGARRTPVTPTDAVVGFLERIPLRAGVTHFVPAPLFHAWGFAHTGLGLLLGARVVLRRRFDPLATLETMSRERAYGVALVPVMAQRILALGDDVLREHPCPDLRVAAFGGSAIPGDLAVRFMDAFGDVVYNTYGSTEVAVVSIATPADLRADPSTAGRPVERIVIKLLDPQGREVPHGEAGRIFVGSSAAFEGYTGGGNKEVVEGLMSTGDMGRFDAAGRLTIEGRDDDMIVSGGENVFPREVEDLIAGLDGVGEVAVVGVPDDEFGQRLRAVVVRAGGAQLTEDDVKAAVKKGLARFKVPRDVVFVDELPRTSTGKVLKRELVGD